MAKQGKINVSGRCELFGLETGQVPRLGIILFGEESTRITNGVARHILATIGKEKIDDVSHCSFTCLLDVGPTGIKHKC